MCSHRCKLTKGCITAKKRPVASKVVKSGGSECDYFTEDLDDESTLKQLFDPWPEIGEENVSPISKNNESNLDLMTNISLTPLKRRTRDTATSPILKMCTPSTTGFQINSSHLSPKTSTPLNTDMAKLFENSQKLSSETKMAASPHKTLKKPESVPLSQKDERLLTSLAKRKLYAGSDNRESDLLQLKTGGLPISFQRVSIPRKKTFNVTKKNPSKDALKMSTK